jgi:glycosyltransferase involved in cell wall biosynthesis
VGGHHKADLIARARALLMPITWNEPFGMVMVEALSCGTPVISFAEGAATEIVRDGVTGFLVPDEQAMAAAVARLPELDPRNCRADMARRFNVDQVAAAYEGAYRRAGARTVLLPSLPAALTLPGPVRPAARGHLDLAPTAG